MQFKLQWQTRQTVAQKGNSFNLIGTREGITQKAAIRRLHAFNDAPCDLFNGSTDDERDRMHMVLSNSVNSVNHNL